MKRVGQVAMVAVSALLAVSIGVQAAQPTRFQKDGTQNPREWRLSPRGLGPIILGAPLQDVAKRSGVAFKRNRIEDSQMLDYVLKSDPGALNVSVCPTGPLRGRIIAIQFYGDWVVTNQGIHIHDSTDKLVRAYGPALKPADAGQHATSYRHDDPQDPRYSVYFSVSRTDPNRNRVTEMSASIKDSGCESW